MRYSACAGVTVITRSSVLTFGSAPSKSDRNGCFFCRCTIRYTLRRFVSYTA